VIGNPTHTYLKYKETFRWKVAVFRCGISHPQNFYRKTASDKLLAQRNWHSEQRPE
jgi:hypothetical protein